MKNTLCLLASFALVACSGGDDKSPADDMARDASLGGNCLVAYQICVGDHLWASPDDSTYKMVTVKEVVAAGELSKAERDEVAQAGPEGAPYIEPQLRDMSKMMGARVFTDGDSSPIAPLLTELTGFSSVYRAKGCVDEKQICVGDKFRAFDARELHDEEFLGFRVSDKGWRVGQPYLVRQSVAGTDKIVQTSDLVRATDAGCAKISISSHDFCVGDVFYTTLNGERPGEDGTYEVKFITTPANGQPAQLIVRNWNGTSYFQIPQEASSYFVKKGCVPGAPDLCLPQVAGETLYFVENTEPYGDVLSARSLFDAQIQGLILSDVAGSTDKPVLLSNASYDNEMRDYAAEDVVKFSFRKAGCGASAHLCVGDQRHFESATSSDPFKILGFNNANDTVLGELTLFSGEMTLIVPASRVSK